MIPTPRERTGHSLGLRARADAGTGHAPIRAGGQSPFTGMVNAHEPPRKPSTRFHAGKKTGGGPATAALLLCVICGICVLLSGCPAPSSVEGPAAPATHATARVIRVIDGDTFVAQLGAETICVRIAVIDAPERGQPGCDAARLELERLILGRDVVLDWRGVTGSRTIDGRPCDVFGRLLARVRVGALDVGQHLLEKGFAVRWRPRR